jgi:hypothetical protein
MAQKSRKRTKSTSHGEGMIRLRPDETDYGNLELVQVLDPMARGCL